jgi:hypothetical protein
MLIVVIASGEGQKEFQDKEMPEGVQVQFLSTLDDAKTNADAYFYLLDINEIDATAEKFKSFEAPVFIKEVVDLKSLPRNVARISPWPGFLFAESIEVQVSVENMQKVTEVFNKLKWKYNNVLVDAI